MDQTDIRVLHVDTEKSWRSGQQQAGYLADHMSKTGYKTAIVCHPKSAFRSYAKSHKIPHFSIDMNGNFDFISGLHIALLAAKNHYNILHLHTSNAVSIGLIARFFNPKLKLVATRRVDYHLHHSKISKFKYRNPSLNKIICITDRIRNVLIEDRIPKNKLVTIRDGIDLHKYDNVIPNAGLREQLGIPENHLIVGTIAALVSQKDYPNLISAAQEVVKQRDDVTFVAVGEGHQRRLLEVMARSMKLNNKFIFAGYHEDTGNFLKLFDIFVKASSQEGSGTSILDAQTVGLPVIATKTGVSSEAVIHEQNSLLVTPNAPEDLAKAILRLCEDSDLRHRLGENGKQTVQQYSIEKTVEKTIKLYEELV